MTVKEYLKERIDAEILLYYKDASKYPQELYGQLQTRWGDDSVFSEEHRYYLLNVFIPDLKSKKILDMAAGCGSFVLQGLRNGYNTTGVEPEDWKQELIDLKFLENDYPKEWRERLVKGIGEKLPFADETFDVFDSWQTIEHVQNEKDCVFELYRVLKKGGVGILRGPDYLCFFEGHYRMFWLPLMGKSKFSKWYVTKLMKRPWEGIDTFHPVNPFKLKRTIREAGFKLVDIKRYQIYKAIERRLPFTKHVIFKPFKWLVYLFWDLYRGIKHFGRGEATVSFFLIKE
jgi:ubiquinone/menaquinone biosynthesis C-methylase UbiE